MLGFRLAAQRPPDAKRITDAVVMRFEHIYEVDPELMTEHVRPAGPCPPGTRCASSTCRWEHLAWMHDHFADSVVSGEELLNEIEAET